MKRNFTSVIVITAFFVLLAAVVGFLVTADVLKVINASPRSNNNGEAAQDSLSDDSVVSPGVLSVVDEMPSVFSPNLVSIHENPVRLVISSIELDLSLEHVGVTDGKLDTPSSWDTAGWYRSGAKTGEEGNMIINAHYDTNTGRPAAFWNLKKIQVNDTVSVVDIYGRQYSYVVNEILYVDIQDPERIKVLEVEDSSSSLTLITCGGVWMQGSGYSKRLIVKAELVQ